MLIVTIFLFIAVYNCKATTIAGKGLLISDPTFRTFLLMSGLGDKISEQGSLLYDLSGFQYLSVPVHPGRRNASTLSHAVVEVDPQFPRRSARMRRDHPLHEKRGQVENVFNVLRNMERSTCVFRLLCDIGYSPKSYGFIGQKIQRYIRSVPPVTWNSATSPYVEAFAVGAGGGLTTCSKLYSCPYNLRRILSLLMPTL